jgi:hypothetical protein
MADFSGAVRDALVARGAGRRHSSPNCTAISSSVTLSTVPVRIVGLSLSYSMMRTLNPGSKNEATVCPVGA